jgi:sulfoxide reductase catalytic subunit YedY
MLIKTRAELPSSEITPEGLYVNRRTFMRAAIAAGAGAALAGTGSAVEGADPKNVWPLTGAAKSAFSTTEKQNSFEDITSYNNFYEFGMDKGDPARYSGRLTVRPWTVKIDGHAAKPGAYQIEDLLKFPLEERVYRMRCVEAWSMVIPWIGFPLAELLKKAEPTSKAKFVAFETLRRPGEMPGQYEASLQWPYVEGLRLDEAMHPLTILAVGLYGKTLLSQNGAPLRLVVPWKYGFKGIKSIVRIRFTEKQPVSSWQIQWPAAYGFYANVNPTVDHPDWSQATEARLPSFFKTTRTLLFNGYGNEVAGLYSSMDLRKNY